MMDFLPLLYSNMVSGVSGRERQREADPPIWYSSNNRAPRPHARAQYPIAASTKRAYYKHVLQEYIMYNG
ncbi:MAG: hypothetical protein GDA56_09065 [Hormoscilla sp. GM7CHS1pb]|nr:hypothetical protein [Hormoscilla sp. GM7CHS1pb]